MRKIKKNIRLEFMDILANDFKEETKIYKIVLFRVIITADSCIHLIIILIV